MGFIEPLGDVTYYTDPEGNTSTDPPGSSYKKRYFAFTDIRNDPKKEIENRYKTVRMEYFTDKQESDAWRKHQKALAEGCRREWSNPVPPIGSRDFTAFGSGNEITGVSGSYYDGKRKRTIRIHTDNRKWEFQRADDPDGPNLDLDKLQALRTGHGPVDLC